MACSWFRFVATLLVVKQVAGQMLPTNEECAAAERIIGNQEATAATVDSLMADAASLRALQSERFATAMSLLSLQQQRRGCVSDDCRANVSADLASTYNTVRGLRSQLLEAGRSALNHQRSVAAAAGTLKMCRARVLACAQSGEASGTDREECMASWRASSSSNSCDLSFFDQLADIEVNGTIDLEAGVAEVLGSLESTGTLDEDDCADVDAFIAATQAATARIQCQGQWAMQAARRLLRSARRILPPYLFVMNQCPRRVVASLNAEEMHQRETDCDEQRALLTQYRTETSVQMHRVNRIGRIVVRFQRQLAAGLQARQRCAVPRPSVEEEVEVQDEVTTSCGPLATISLGSIMDSIEAATPEAPGPAALAGIADSLQRAVAQFSSKLFCAVEDLKGRIPLADAIDLLRLYRQHMNCGRDYIANYGVCRDARAADMVDPAVSRRDAIASGKACVAAAKATRSECRAALAPVMQRTRSEIRSSLNLIHEDATILMRWTEAQARLLQPQYDAVRDQLQAIVDRSSRLGEIRSRIRSDLFEDDV